MAYTPTEWSTGDTITAAALNKMENGIANSGGGFDAEVLLTDPGGNVTWTATVESGSFAGIAAILEDGGVPRIRVSFAMSGSSYKWSTETTAITYYGPTYTVPVFNFSALQYDFGNGDFTQIYLGWDAQENIWVD